MPFSQQHAWLAGLLTLPWLWPFTSGPVAVTQPYLASAVLAALALAWWPVRDRATAVQAVAAAWLAAAVASSVIALLQYFDLEAALYPWVNIAQPGQAFGNLRQPNQLASLLVMGALALRWWVQAGRVRLLAAVALGVLLMAALAATASRVGLVALLGGGALVAWWSVRAGPGQRPMVALLAVAAAVGAYALTALALPGLAQWADGVAGRDMLERLRTAESTCGSRLILWRNVLHLIGLKPWTGWGWGELDYAHYITLYDGPRFCHILDNAHNLPLHLAVELGVPVALLACALLLWALWRSRPWAEQDPTRQLAWGVLAVIGIHSLVEYPLWYGPFQIAVALCVWLLWSTRRGAARVADTESDGTPSVIPAQAGIHASLRAAAWSPRMDSRLRGNDETSNVFGLNDFGVKGAPLAGLNALRYMAAAAMLAATAYAGWDYHRVSQIYRPLEQRAAPYRDDAMAHAQRSWLYADVVRFAEVTTRPAVRDNAAWMLPTALRALHFSPEPRVITKVIESATLLGRDELALEHLARFRAAFPKEHAKWVADNARVLEGARGQLQRGGESPQ